MKQALSFRPWQIALAVALPFAVLLAVWIGFNHALPGTDESGHILNALSYTDLLRHPKIWRADWWHNFLTVNQFYPPFTHLFNGLLHAVFGPGRWVDAASSIVFNIVMSLSTFGMTRILTGSIRAAALAVVVINLYPQASHLNHLYLLDFPLMAMVGLGLCSLVWLKEKPAWRRAVATGFALGAAVMSKQIAAAFLLFPGIYLTLSSLRTADGKFQPKGALPFLAAAGIGACLALPWTLVNAGAVASFAKYNSSKIGEIGVVQALLSNLTFYVEGLPNLMSPMLFIIFLVSIALGGGRAHRLLLPVTLSSAGGVFLISTLTWAFPLDRYAMSALYVCACYSGVGLDRLLGSRFAMVKTVPALVILVALLQFLSFHFTPYPLSGPPAFVNLKTSMGIALREFRGDVITDGSPEPPSDWGQSWAIDVIDKSDPKVPLWLNVTTNSEALSVHTFELLARDKGSLVRPTTCRTWTVMGDEVKYSPESVLWYQWYLLKSGDQGNIFKDEVSADNFARVKQTVEKGGRFRLVAEKQLPDGSTMSLWRQN